MEEKLDIIIKNMNNIEIRLSNIEEKIENIKINSSKMNEHITFIETTYDALRTPLGYIKNNDNQNLHRSINYNHYFVVKSSENYKNMYTIHNKKHYSKYKEPLYK